MVKSKILGILMIIMFLFVSVNGVSVVKQDTNTAPPAENSLIRTIIIWVFVMGFISVFIIGAVLIFAWILVKIYKKLTEYNKRKKDFIFSMFEDDLMKCHINRDSKLKKRNWKLMWVFFKRAPIYYDHSEEGIKFLGFYNGEGVNKEGYYMISIYNKIGIFKFIEQIVYFPLKIKSRLLKDPVVDGKRNIMLQCDGIDNMLKTDYMLIPLIKDEKRGGFIDFSDEIYDKYIKKTVYRTIIKEDLLYYKDAIGKAVDSNPKLQLKRRSE